MGRESVQTTLDDFCEGEDTSTWADLNQLVRPLLGIVVIVLAVFCDTPLDSMLSSLGIYLLGPSIDSLFE
jgi:hypothetical protein